MCFRAESDTYRLVQKGANQKMWNEVMREHRASHPGCEGDLYWPDDLEEQRGLCWAVQAKCSNCSYLSAKYKLYNEVSRPGPGRKQAGPNVALAAALTQTSAGPSSIRKVLLAKNMHLHHQPGHCKSLQVAYQKKL